VKKTTDIDMGSRIKKSRIALGYTQDEFAEKSGYSRPTISRIETGLSSAHDRFITVLCDKFNVNKEWLETGEGEMFLAFNSNSKEDEYFKAATLIAKSDDKVGMQLVIEYFHLSDENKKNFKNALLNLAAAAELEKTKLNK